MNRTPRPTKRPAPREPSGAAMEAAKEARWLAVSVMQDYQEGEAVYTLAVALERLIDERIAAAASLPLAKAAARETLTR